MSEDNERWKNFMIYKVWATDKEMEDLAPFYAIFTLVVIGGVGGFALLSKLGVI